MQQSNIKLLATENTMNFLTLQTYFYLLSENYGLIIQKEAKFIRIINLQNAIILNEINLKGMIEISDYDTDWCDIDSLKINENNFILVFFCKSTIAVSRLIITETGVNLRFLWRKPLLDEIILSVCPFQPFSMVTYDFESENISNYRMINNKIVLAKQFNYDYGVEEIMFCNQNTIYIYNKGLITGLNLLTEQQTLEIDCYNCCYYQIFSNCDSKSRRYFGNLLTKDVEKAHQSICSVLRKQIIGVRITKDNLILAQKESKNKLCLRQIELEQMDNQANREIEYQDLPSKMEVSLTEDKLVISGELGFQLYSYHL